MAKHWEDMDHWDTPRSGRWNRFAPWLVATAAVCFALGLVSGSMWFPRTVNLDNSESAGTYPQSESVYFTWRKQRFTTCTQWKYGQPDLSNGKAECGYNYSGC